MKRILGWALVLFAVAWPWYSIIINEDAYTVVATLFAALLYGAGTLGLMLLGWWLINN